MGGRACVFVRVSAVRVFTVLVRGLGMNGRVCSFVRASAVRMCTVTVLGLGLSAYSLPGGVYGQNFYWLVHYICTCARTVRSSAWAVRAVYHVCVCVFVYSGQRVQLERCTTRREYVYACVAQYMVWWLGRRP